MWYGSFRRPLAAVSAAISAVLLTSAGVAAGSSEPPVDEWPNPGEEVEWPNSLRVPGIGASGRGVGA